MRAFFTTPMFLAGLTFSLQARAGPGTTVLDFPCKGCLTRVPSDASGASPRPLLVALHGDGGGAQRLFDAWIGATDEAGVVLVALRCPQDLGCRTGSFWQWLADPRHDPAWLGAQMDRVRADFAIDPRRIYATGYSGGATYLGWYAPTHPAQFAAVAHIAGGNAYGVACPSCKVPVLFTLGARDPMLLPYTRPLRDYYDACGGHEIAWETLPGVSHEGILGVLAAGKAKSILGWLLARPAACETMSRDEGGASPPEPRGAGPASIAGASSNTQSSASVEGPALSTSHSPKGVTPSARGCSCAVGGGDGDLSCAAGFIALGAFAFASRRRRAV